MWVLGLPTRRSLLFPTDFVFVELAIGTTFRQPKSWNDCVLCHQYRPNALRDETAQTTGRSSLAASEWAALTVTRLNPFWQSRHRADDNDMLSTARHFDNQSEARVGTLWKAIPARALLIHGGFIARPAENQRRAIWECPCLVAKPGAADRRGRSRRLSQSDAHGASAFPHAPWASAQSALQRHDHKLRAMLTSNPARDHRQKDRGAG